MYIVYLNVKQNRLVISTNFISDKDYHFLFFSEGNPDQALAFCKAVCVGFIYGGIYGKKVINDSSEFMENIS